MLAFSLGLLALVIGLLAVEAFLRANPAILAQRIRNTMFVVFVVSGILVYVRGFVSLGALMELAAVFLVLRPYLGRQSTHPTPGQSSRVTTDYIEMELDHDSGRMSGRVLQGAFKDRAIEDLTPAELALIWQECRLSDPRSATLIEAYLDSVHSSWREDMASREEERSPGPGGRMGVAEAYEILGIKPGASPDDIRRAHRELMMKLHPDRGGSTYLAAKINEAKAVLLGD